MEKQVTIKDIARELGISPSTVSRALKNHPDISDATKKSVKELANKLNYKPNEIALSLKHNKSKIIGVIVPEVVHYFFSSVISGIDDLAYKNQYSVMMAQSNEDFNKEIYSVQAMMSGRVAGLLVSMSKTTTDVGHFQTVINSGIPVVFFDRVCEDINADKVVVDDFDGAYRAVTHLIKTGCRKIVHFATTHRLLIGRNRQNGYLHALFKNGIAIDDNLIFECDNYEQAVAITDNLIKSNAIPDAIFAVNDMSALGALAALKKNGIKVPEQVSIIGFSNGLISSVSDPKLSTVEQYGFKMGQIAVQILLDRINNKDNAKTSKEQTVLQTDLILRGTTK